MNVKIGPNVTETQVKLIIQLICSDVEIASGEIVEYPVSEAYMTLEGKGVTSLVAIATEKTPTLLGVTTLELLGLEVDLITGKLTPLELMILQML